ncbi:hypothetical protein D9619_013200 [Psilocybe cf. subviscida]|uniref:PAS domain-containing protein n=1 Tax=Psilocybe cf. subviscida TaxID=2480587 RepID=A0A8H5B6M4_9AGAR|nr:hypothetical protein D9619_013200 [Psilocybe cf. subviscida]
MLMGSSSTPNLSFIGIVDFSQEARWIFMTESVTDLLGYEPRDLVGRPSLELVHPDEFPRVKQLHYDTIRQDKAAVLVYLRMKHKDPLKGYVLCGVSRTVVHNVLVGSVSFANPNKALQNASTAQEITVIAPEARNFQFRRWHDASPMPPSPIPERMRVLPQAFLDGLDAMASGARNGMNGMGGGGGGGGGAVIEYVDVPDRSATGPNGPNGHASSYGSYARRGAPSSPPRSPSPPPPQQYPQHQSPASPYHHGASESTPYRSPPPLSPYDRDDEYQREYDYEYTRRGAHESYARRRSPSYTTDSYERDREYPPSPDSPVYTPQSPYATPLDSRRRLSDSSSSSSSGSSGSGARASGNHTRNGVNVANGAKGVNGVHGSNGVDIDVDGDAGSDRRLGHSTSWTRRRLESATPTPASSRRVRSEELDVGRQRDIDMDGDRDAEEARRRGRERELARDLDEEERRYRERGRYLSPDSGDRYRDRDVRDRDTDRDRDFAANRYYSPAPPSSTLNGVNGHGHGRGVNGTAPNRGHPSEAHVRRSLTPPPSPPRSAYRSTSNHAPASPTYASITRGSPPYRHLLPSPRILLQPVSPMAPPPPLPPIIRHREPSPVIEFDHLPAQSSRTAFILDRFTDKSSIMYCSNTLLVCPTSAGSLSPSSSPTTVQGRRSGSPPNSNHKHNNRNRDATDELAQANAIGRPFFDFVVPRDEQIVRDWIACVKGWGVNEKGQPSDGGFGFGRFGLIREGRDSA